MQILHVTSFVVLIFKKQFISYLTFWLIDKMLLHFFFKSVSRILLN